ncbi:MAG: hypothetical protein COB60_07845 [Flavobacteriaceae bacterium]|nr:MAG: hypothetical protein COB60_07845 [Flavobacteriaceae bacterium]
MRNFFTIVLLCMLSQASWAQNTSRVSPVFETLHQFPNVRDIAITASGYEAFITVQSPLGEIAVLVQLQKVSGKWKAMGILPFSGSYQDMEPFLSQDNLTLYFASNRPLTDSIQAVKDFDIWKVKRASIISPWGKPINMGAPINTSYNEFYPSLSSNNNMYFTSDKPTELGKDNIWFSQKLAQGYGTPVTLSKAINSDGYEFNAFVAADESYLIFSGYNRKEGVGSGDLYLSTKTENGDWSTAQNLGKEINSKYMDYCPFVDSKTETLYFTSKRSGYEKVNDFNNLEALIQSLNKKENGQSRLYKMSLKGLLR